MFKKLLLGLLLISPFSALAHPHAFIDMQTKPLVKDNQLIGFSTQWLLDEASSSAVLYDVKQAKGDKAAQQKLVDEVMANVVNEHYFSYVFDKEEIEALARNKDNFTGKIYAYNYSTGQRDRILSSTESYITGESLNSYLSGDGEMRITYKMDASDEYGPAPVLSLIYKKQ